jgi:hypothetical protein
LLNLSSDKAVLHRRRAAYHAHQAKGKFPMIKFVSNAPPQLGGSLVWVETCGGWDLRRVRKVGRRQFAKYVCHLSNARWQRMCAQHSETALPDALRQWAKGFRKAITLGRTHIGITGD